MRKDQAKISKKPESWEEVNTDFMCHPSVHGAISKNAYERGKIAGQLEAYENVINLGDQQHSISATLKRLLLRQLEKLEKGSDEKES